MQRIGYMNNIDPLGRESRGGFSLDAVRPDAPPGAFDSFRREWEAQIGDGFRLPTFNTATKGDFRVKTRATRVRDVAITDVLSVSPIQTSGTVVEVEDQVRIWVMGRGGWTLDGTRKHGQHTVTAGSFLLRHIGQPSDFDVAPHTEGKDRRSARRPAQASDRRSECHRSRGRSRDATADCPREHGPLHDERTQPRRGACCPRYADRAGQGSREKPVRRCRAANRASSRPGRKGPREQPSCRSRTVPSNVGP